MLNDKIKGYLLGLAVGILMSLYLFGAFDGKA